MIFYINFYLLIVHIKYGSSQYFRPPSNLATVFANEINSLNISEPAYQVKGTSQQLDNYYHVGVVFCYINNNDTLTGGKISQSGRLIICAQLSDQINDANLLLKTFRIALYLIDCFLLESAYPGSLYDLDIVSNATKDLQSRIGFPVLIVYIDNSLQNRWQLTFNYTYHPCQSVYFVWNNQQNSYLSNIRYLAGNVISKLYNVDISICKNCNASCYHEFAIKDWSRIKNEHVTCVLNNIRQSYSSSQFNCFKKSPNYTNQPYCGNGIIEDKEECDCLIRVPGDCELNNCALFGCTLNFEKRKALNGLLLIFCGATLFVVFVSIFILTCCVQKPKPAPKKMEKDLNVKSSDSLVGIRSDNLGLYFMSLDKGKKNVKAKIFSSSLSFKSVIVSDKPKFGVKSGILLKSKSKSNIGINLRSKSVSQSRPSKTKLRKTEPLKAPPSKTQLQKTEPPKIQVSKTQLPKTGPSRTQLLRTQLPKTEPSKTQLPKVTPSKTQFLKTQPSKTQVLKTGLSKTQLSKTQLPKTNPTKTQLSKTQLPKTQPPNTEPSKIQLPKAASSKTQLLKTQPPKTQVQKTEPTKTKLSEIKIHKQN